MKPRQKVVTAEDITSSLYFLHVEQPEDANLVAPIEAQESHIMGSYPAAPNVPPIPTVQRKALPGASIMPPVRKPLSGVLAPINDFGDGQNMMAGKRSHQPEIMAPDYNVGHSFDAHKHQRENQPLAPSSHRSMQTPRQAGTSLMLIRRDPTSGAQWNVARIEDPPAFDVSSSNLNERGTKRSIGAPMYIDVTNPGYSKFLHSGDTSHINSATDPNDLHVQSLPIRRAPLTQMPAPSADGRTIPSPNIFRRRLWMEGSQYTGASFGYRKNSSYDFNSRRPVSRDSYDARADRSLGDTMPAPPPAFLSRDDQAYSTIQVSDRQTSFRGYVFTSPWNGRCEFVTGAGGGSLKVMTRFELRLCSH
jgi:hypothetical protein